MSIVATLEDGGTGELYAEMEGLSIGGVSIMFAVLRYLPDLCANAMVLC
eukprot:SAG31_NODE_13566_length_861_cov_0.654856_3_plen_49_part_00